MVGTQDTVVGRVDAVLAAFVDERAATLLQMGADLAPIADSARACVLDGGKRLRPTFAYWGWRTVASDEGGDRGLFTAAAALELLHASALVHDDLMDASETRRGNPATHTAFTRWHRQRGWAGDAAGFGASTAIIVGDLLLMWSDALFASASIDSLRLARARQVFNDMRQLVMGGQYLDLVVQARAEFSPAEALRVVEFKTSKYTVEGPLHLGAAIAGAPPEVFSALTAYGLAVGEAFQLRDDVLGVFGDPAVTGKPAGDDLREGKHTLLTALAAQGADPDDAHQLRALLGDRDIDAAGIATLQKIIVDTGALAQVERRITDQAATACAALDAALIGADARGALGALAASAAHRTS